MLAILIELLLSWILLHFIEHQNLEVLGFRPTPRRLKLAGIGFALTAAYMTLYYLGEATLLHNPYHKNPAFATQPFLDSIWHYLKSVLFEELLFRGALLYILVKRLGAAKAVLVSAVAFGIYHFFTVGLGSPMQIVLLFLTTGLMGYAFARAYVVTGSIWVPFALHYALNFISYIIFGALFIHPSVAHPSMAIVLVLLVIHNFVYPLVVLWWLHRIKPNRLHFKNIL
jgi:membrane protease YdiL (CAAX protease family)